MSSINIRRTPCDLCVLLLFGFSIILAQESADSPSTQAPKCLKGYCRCGGFNTTLPRPDEEPMLSQNALVVKCAPESIESCKNLCVALAMATKAKGPIILCSRLKDANELLLSVFYKVCNDPWTYGNMTMEAPLCCEDGNFKECLSAQGGVHAPSHMTVL